MPGDTRTSDWRRSNPGRPRRLVGMKSEVVGRILDELPGRSSEAPRQISCTDLLHQGDRHRGVRKRTVDRVSEASEPRDVVPRGDPVDRCDSRLRIRLHQRDCGPEVLSIRSDDLFHRDPVVRALEKLSYSLDVSYHESLFIRIVTG